MLPFCNLSKAIIETRSTTGNTDRIIQSRSLNRAYSLQNYSLYMSTHAQISSLKSERTNLNDIISSVCRNIADSIVHTYDDVLLKFMRL